MCSRRARFERGCLLNGLCGCRHDIREEVWTGGETGDHTGDPQ